MIFGSGWGVSLLAVADGQSRFKAARRGLLGVVPFNANVGTHSSSVQD